MAQEQKKIEADMVRAEGRKLSKLKGKHDKTYLRRAQEKRFEQQVLLEAAAMKKE